jgi:hypothetical protein
MAAIGPDRLIQQVAINRHVPLPVPNNNALECMSPPLSDDGTFSLPTLPEMRGPDSSGEHVQMYIHVPMPIRPLPSPRTPRRTSQKHMTSSNLPTSIPRHPLHLSLALNHPRTRPVHACIRSDLAAMSAKATTAAHAVPPTSGPLLAFAADPRNGEFLTYLFALLNSCHFTIALACSREGVSARVSPPTLCGSR